MLLDQEMLAVNDVCRIEECCASVYANVSCSQKLLLRRVAAYQWRGFSLFCTKARRIFAQLAEHVQFLVRHRATLVALRNPIYMIETARCELRKWKSILRRYCEFVQVNFCDMISETQEVTQTDYSFWQVLLQVEADKLEHFFDTKHRYSMTSFSSCHIEFNAKLNRASAVAMTACIAGSTDCFYLFGQRR